MIASDRWDCEWTDPSRRTGHDLLDALNLLSQAPTATPIDPIAAVTVTMRAVDAATRVDPSAATRLHPAAVHELLNPLATHPHPDARLLPATYSPTPTVLHQLASDPHPGVAATAATQWLTVLAAA